MGLGGVVEGGVKAPIGVECLLNEPFDGSWLANIGCDGKRPRACVTQLTGERLQRLRIARSQRDRGARSSPSLSADRCQPSTALPPL